MGLPWLFIDAQTRVFAPPPDAFAFQLGRIGGNLIAVGAGFAIQVGGTAIGVVTSPTGAGALVAVGAIPIGQAVIVSGDRLRL